MAREEEGGEAGDVLAPFPERRERDRHDGEAVVEILAEALLADLRREVAVRRRDHADVDLDALRPADPLEGARLEDAEELRLGRGCHLAHLVEEERPAVRGFEAAASACHRPGERAPLVAEELALDERVDERGRVDRHERAVAPGAPGVESPGCELLARAALAREQDARLAPGGAGEEGSHAADRRRAPPELLVFGRGLQAATFPFQPDEVSHESERGPGGGAEAEEELEIVLGERGVAPEEPENAQALLPPQDRDGRGVVSVDAERDRLPAFEGLCGGPGGRRRGRGLPREDDGLLQPVPLVAEEDRPGQPSDRVEGRLQERPGEPFLRPCDGESAARGKEEPEAPLGLPGGRGRGLSREDRLRERKADRGKDLGLRKASSAILPGRRRFGAEDEDARAELDPVSRREEVVCRGEAVDPQAVEASEVTEPPPVRCLREGRVTPGQSGIRKADPARGVATQHDFLRLEGDLGAPGRSRDDHEPGRHLFLLRFCYPRC